MAENPLIDTHEWLHWRAVRIVKPAGAVDADCIREVEREQPTPRLDARMAIILII